MLVASLHSILHWPDQGGYNFISGPFADVTILTAFLGTLYLWWRRHNCHVHRCWRIQWHAHPVHGHPVCKHHHPDAHRIRADGAIANERLRGRHGGRAGEPAPASPSGARDAAEPR